MEAAKRGASSLGKMMKGLTVDGKIRRSLADSSDDDSMDMNTDPKVAEASRAIKKKNRKSRAYYDNLKKSLRRKIKDGTVIREDKLD